MDIQFDYPGGIFGNIPLTNRKRKEKIMILEN